MKRFEVEYMICTLDGRADSLTKTITVEAEDMEGAYHEVRNMGVGSDYFVRISRIGEKPKIPIDKP